MSFLAAADRPTGLVSSELDPSKGTELREAYLRASPFPHIVIEEFLPVGILEMCLVDFPARPHAGDVTFQSPQERLKTQYSPDALSERVRSLFYSFNSLPFIRVLENITGIKGLIPDPYFLGGGFHEIKEGGHLSVHADFNHHKPMDLERRINVLIYLNKDWSDDFGGNLELWDREMMHCVKRISPAFNRCVIFNTTDNSFHGNPEPVRHPAGVSRKSIALYYYTATWTGDRREHSTHFRGRPGAGDEPRFSPRALLTDWLPPAVNRGLRRLRKGHG